MKTSKEKLLKKLHSMKQENLQMLIQWSYKDLEEIKNNYYEAFKYTNSEFIYEKFSQVDEAITIKKGNDEDIWDFLT